MENLTRDPIIEFYLNFSQSTEKEASLPVFSETLLRLAARHALDNVRPVDAETLTLYRKLILYYYAETHTVVDDLLKIMPCFTENELIKCFKDFEKVKKDWEAFTTNNLIYFIRKKAFFAIFTEWTRRYIHLHEEVDPAKLRCQAIKIHSFFNWGTKCVNQWLRSFQTNTLKGNWAESDTDRLEGITEIDLEIPNIALDIKDQLHPLIYKELQEIISIREESSDEESEEHDNENMNSPSSAKRSKTVEINTTQMETFEQQIHIQADLSEQDDDIVRVLEVSEAESEANEDGTSVHTELEEIEAEEEKAIINDDKARKYLSALQAYVVVNGLYDAIPLLDRVDSILRVKQEKKTP